jgi:hypothetical protein
MTGLMLLFGDVGVAMADVPIGPGPTNYTEQPQPPPGTCHYRTAANGQTLPDPTCTPGAISPKVTQDKTAMAAQEHVQRPGAAAVDRWSRVVVMRTGNCGHPQTVA